MDKTYLVALDAGHGLKTAGKQTPDGIKEWTLNDKVCDKIALYLSDYNVVVLRTDNNEGNVDESLSVRRKMYVDEDADVFVSIHHNAYLGVWSNATGVEVYTDKNETSKDRELAELIYKRLVEYTGLKGRGIKEANFTVINQNSIPAVLVEGGFMDSKTDYTLITSEQGQDAYARAVTEGIVEFLGLTKKEAPKPVVKNNGFSQEVQDWQNAAIKDGFKFPKYGADGKWGSECESVAKVAIVKERKDKNGKAIYKYPNLTKIVQKKVGAEVDGKFGDESGDKVEIYQRNNGLTEDRCVGLNTWKKILNV